MKGAHDLVIAMYHDQGAIPLKLHAFETGVNITLGIRLFAHPLTIALPMILPGQGIVDPVP